MSVLLDASLHEEARDPRTQAWLRAQGIAPDVTKSVRVGRFFIRAEQCLLDGEGRKFLEGDDVAMRTRWFLRRTPLPRCLHPEGN